jgi:hypothetical protein
VEVELALAEGLPQVDRERVAEARAENFYRKEERSPAGDPTRAVRSDTTTGHHAVNMRVEMEVLSPRVQYGQKTNGGAQALGVRRNREQGFGNGPKQDGIDGPGVL